MKLDEQYTSIDYPEKGDSIDIPLTYEFLKTLIEDLKEEKNETKVLKSHNNTVIYNLGDLRAYYSKLLVEDARYLSEGVIRDIEEFVNAFMKVTGEGVDKEYAISASIIFEKTITSFLTLKEVHRLSFLLLNQTTSDSNWRFPKFVLNDIKEMYDKAASYYSVVEFYKEVRIGLPFIYRPLWDRVFDDWFWMKRVTMSTSIKDGDMAKLLDKIDGIINSETSKLKAVGVKIIGK